MRKLVLFMHVSLDGFVAGPKGEMDWIAVDNEMFEYAGNRTNEPDTGSPTVARALSQENLLDEYWLFINPILVGQGIPLFKAIQRNVNLKLLSRMFSLLVWFVSITRAFKQNRKR